MTSSDDRISVDGDQRRVVVDDAESLRLTLDANVEVSGLSGIGFDGDGALLGLMVRVTSVSSRVRRSVPAPNGQFSHTFEIDIPIGELRGELTVDVVLVLRSDVEEVPGRACAVGSVVAESRPWTVVIDQREAPPGRGIRIEWTSFADPTNADLPEAQLFAVRLEGEPVLLLNRDIDNAYEVLESRGTHGAKARIRDAIFHQIVNQVWTSLIGTAWSHFVAACAEDNLDGVEILDELTAWQREVIVDWAPLLVPDVNGDREQAVLEMISMARDAGSSGQFLVHRVPAAIQERFRTVRSFEGLVREAQLFGGASDDD